MSTTFSRCYRCSRCFTSPANQHCRRPTAPGPGLLPGRALWPCGARKAETGRWLGKKQGPRRGGTGGGQEAEALRERMSLAGRMSADAGEDVRPGPLLRWLCSSSSWCSCAAAFLRSSSFSTVFLPWEIISFAPIRHRTRPRIKHRIE